MYKYMVYVHDMFLVIHKEHPEQAWEPSFITIWLLFKTLIKKPGPILLIHKRD
jgi:hypothetical protein